MNTNSITYYQLILDASGSMSSMRIETLNAVNRQIEAIREMAAKNADQPIRVSLTVFNTDTHKVFSRLSPDNVNLLTMRQYKTDGSTALLDAIGLSLSDLQESTGPEDDVVVLILTDGEENASQYFSFKQIAGKIRALKKTERWTFSFLGADIDAWSIARNLHIDMEEVQSIERSDMPRAMEKTANLMEDYIVRKRAGIRDGFMKDRS